MKKIVKAVGSCLLISTANLVHLRPNWAELAVLFSRQLPSAPKIFFSYFQHILFKLFRYETIETHALAFLTHIILAIVGVRDDLANKKKSNFRK
jgi:hypothetical protein